MLTATQTNQEVRERLEKDLKIYFAKGGTIKKFPSCTYSDHVLTEKQRFDARYGQRSVR
jgi:hypothetical protein